MVLGENRIGVSVGGLRLRNPIILGSSGLTRSRTGIRKQIEGGYGAIVTKTVTESPRAGAPKPAVFWYDDEKTLLSGAEALENPGCDQMAESIHQNMGLADRRGCKILASVSEQSPEKFARVAAKLGRAGAHGIELNFACPAVGPHLGEEYDRLGQYWSQTPQRAIEVIRAVRESVRLPIWSKVRIAHLIRNDFLAQVDESAKPDAYAFRGGAMPCLVIDVHTGHPRLPGNVRLRWEKGISTYPSVSGPIKTSTILYTAYLAKLTSTPLISLGGLCRGMDVVEAFMAGSSAVGICTAVYREGQSCRRILQELERFLEEKGCFSIEELKGVALKFLPAPPVLSVPGI